MRDKLFFSNLSVSHAVKFICPALNGRSRICVVHTTILASAFRGCIVPNPTVMRGQRLPTSPHASLDDLGARTDQVRSLVEYM